MVVKKIVKYVNVEDSNGSPVGSWAVELWQELRNVSFVIAGLVTKVERIH